MNKEYLETLGKNIRYKKEYIGAGLYRLYIKRNDIELLEQSLQRLESIDNANPGEALEKLEELDNCLISDMSIEIDDYDESNYCMSYEYIDLNGEGLLFHDDIKEEKMIDFIREKKISTIKQALLKAQEQEKVLEIIKEKNVWVARLKGLIKKYNDLDALRIYNANMPSIDYQLTQQEFELLKRWLG